MSTPAAHFETREHEHDSAELGIWIFLATELMFFGPLFLAYAILRTASPDAFAAASRHTDIVIGTANTAILLTSSLLAALASRSAQIGRRRTAMACLWSTALLGTVFLVLKGFEYLHEWQEHLVPWLGFRFESTHAVGASQFFFLYFATTGLHALHLTIGIGVVACFAWQLRTRSPGAMRMRIEIGALYWHFVDAIWVVLFPLLYLVGRYQ
jgi:cytochrome c oxidase subunit 3